MALSENTNFIVRPRSRAVLGRLRAFWGSVTLWTVGLVVLTKIAWDSRKAESSAEYRKFYEDHT